MKTYPGSSTRIVDKLPLYRCRCGHETWALTTDRAVICRKCGREMENTDGKTKRYKSVQKDPEAREKSKAPGVRYAGADDTDLDIRNGAVDRQIPGNGGV